jgi:adenosylcobyric acid synthase
MRAAEIADADCILVVNVEWGGSFAYAAGTIELMPEEDRKRIKGIILNNMRGKTGGMKPGIEMLEKITGVPVVGIIPHLDIELPKEDSEYFRDIDVQGSGTWNIAVIKLPRIANFTDIDPLALEDVTIRYVTTPEGLEGADAIIIPGTKNTMADLDWLKKTGLADAIKKRSGIIPILGICGGYQMMGRKLFDPNAIEDKDFPEADGLGLFDMTAKWDVYDKIVRQDHGVMNVSDRGEVDGYEIHMGQTVTNNEKPLFTLNFLKGDENEGSVREPLKLYGTYLHGVFERPAFRRYFISMMNKGTRAETSKPSKDYMDSENLNLDKLADGFEKGMDMDAFFKILEATR